MIALALRSIRPGEARPPEAVEPLTRLDLEVAARRERNRLIRVERGAVDVRGAVEEQLASARGRRGRS